jgi:serine/threonine protein kinase
MVLSIAQFFDRLRESEVIAAEEVEALWRRIPEDKQERDSAKLVEKLVEAKKLTPYQASVIVEGKNQTLAMGDYVILNPIGAGGMGQVFRALHRRMKRNVALKLLPPAVTKDTSAVRRFQREVEAAARLIHPNIVAAYDAGEEKGIHFLVMEYVDGDDLANLVKKQGPLSVEKALSYVVQAARGMAHAHSQGVIHRDIKPANLLLQTSPDSSAPGVVKILDLGLARFEDESLAQAGDVLTHTGSLMGTPDFMAPEQALNTKNADARSDVYSLGCTLYFLLTGRKMYEGDTMMQRLVAHREQPIPALARAKHDVPARLAAVFERMVAKQPNDRYQSMDEVDAALTACRPSEVGSFIAASGFSTTMAPAQDATECENVLLAEIVSLDEVLESDQDSPAGTVALAETPTKVNLPSPFAPAHPGPTPTFDPSSPSRVVSFTREEARRRLMFPAIGVGLSALVWLGYAVYLICWMAFDLTTEADAVDTVALFIGEALFFLLFVIPSLVTLVGAIQMIRVRGYWWAVAGAVAASLPLSFCFPIAMPFGIWGIVMLCDRRMRLAFNPGVSPFRNR